MPLVSNVAGKVRPTLGLDMIRVAFKGNSIATRAGINGIEEIIIQTKAIGNASIPTDENGRVYNSFGDVSKAQGDRRLNVLFTRAKDKIFLVTSLKSCLAAPRYN